MVAIDEFIDVREVDEAAELVQPLFDRRYRLPVPEFPRHVVGMYRGPDGREEPASYIHFTDCGELLLSGGACTDNRLLRRMTRDQRDALRAVGGVMQYTGAWSARHFATRFDAMFAYTGDTIMEHVLDQLRWQATPHPRLLVLWLRDVDARRRRQIIAKAHSFGAF